jgi:hypothetical protein
VNEDPAHRGVRFPGMKLNLPELPARCPPFTYGEVLEVVPPDGMLDGEYVNPSTAYEVIKIIKVRSLQPVPQLAFQIFAGMASNPPKYSSSTGPVRTEFLSRFFGYRIAGNRSWLFIVFDFLALNTQCPKKLSHGLVIVSTGSHSSSSSPTPSPPSATLPRNSVNRSFLQVVFFSSGLPFALVRLDLELFSSSLFFE